MPDPFETVAEIYDEDLKGFHDWLQAKGEDPRIELTLRWISEFELYAEDDEEQLREIKAILKSRDDPEAASVLRLITEFEETEEPWSMLKRLDDWLDEEKADDPTAVLAHWWLGEFTGE